MKVILHADDFGFDKDTTEATIELLECGVLTSATIMANMPASDIAIAYAKEHPEKSWGVHLTYVDGLKPMCEANEIPTLVDSEMGGGFYDSNIVRKQAMLLRQSKQDIVKESLAQIKKLQNAGIAISHLDSHGHLHKFPSFLFAMKEISMHTGIGKIRKVQDIFLKKPQFSPRTLLNSLFDAYIKRHFITTDYFYMSANSMDTDWAETIAAKLADLSKNKVIEIGVHPGNIEDWRKQEKVDILAFYELIKHKHNIITWNNLV